MPRAIAPEVTTTTSTPASVQRRDLLADPGDHGQPQRAGVLGDDRRPELDDGDGHGPRAYEGSSSNTMPPISTSSPGFEPCPLERADHAHPPQPLLDERLRLLVLEVPAQDQALDGVAGDDPVAVRARA